MLKTISRRHHNTLLGFVLFVVYRGVETAWEDHQGRRAGNLLPLVIRTHIYVWRLEIKAKFAVSAEKFRLRKGDFTKGRKKNIDQGCLQQSGIKKKLSDGNPIVNR